MSKQADIQSMHEMLDEIVSDQSLGSDVRDAIDALRVALDSGDLTEVTVKEMLEALEPQ